MNWLHVVRWVMDISWLSLLLLLFWHFWQVRSALVHAQSWLKARGRITHCEWIHVGHSVWPKIEYSYQVYEKDLIGEYLFLDTSHNNPNSKYSRSIAYKAALAFKENSDIDVYYNPNHPEQSALDVTIPKKLNVIIVLISLLIALHTAVIVSHLLR